MDFLADANPSSAGTGFSPFLLQICFPGGIFSTINMAGNPPHLRIDEPSAHLGCAGRAATLATAASSWENPAERSAAP
jgi:hypothetical protein